MENVQLINSTLQLLLRSLEPSRERAMVVRWKEEFERYGNQRDQKQKILNAITGGYNTYSEIISETKIPRSTVMKIVERLLRDNTLQKTLIKKSNSRNELHFELTRKN